MTALPRLTPLHRAALTAGGSIGASPKAAEPSLSANGPCGASAEGNDAAKPPAVSVVVPPAKPEGQA